MVSGGRTASRHLIPIELKQEWSSADRMARVVVEGQSYFDRQYADDANRRRYQFGEFENVSICGSSTYHCGSVAGTPGYICASELLRHIGR